MKNQSIEDFEKEYLELLYQEIFYIADEDTYYEWLKEQYHNLEILQ